ncbi:MAG TPA: ABC transporter permease [Acetobacteraceae bacterium]|jgi:lipopolysaccharide transport system permease protein|nr:ABC transporter permease [Acetobacteraceae bacterium]
MSAAPANAPSITARDVALELHGDRSRRHLAALAVRDLREGLTLWRLALTLGWLDIRLRYRGSLLGPFWLTLSTAVMIGALGLLYGALFHMDVRTYLPFLALSQVLWAFLGLLIADACACFTQSEVVIRSVRMPLFVHALRVLVRNLLVLAHNVVVIVAVDLIFAVSPGVMALLCLPGIALWLVDSLAICVLLGAVGARFRDIPPIVASITQIAFFITPVMWKPEQLGARVWVLPFNPFFDLLEIVRAPLLGEMPTATVWGAALGYSAVLLALSWWLFTRARGRVPFWI